MFLLFITGLCLIDAVTSASCGQTSFTGFRGTVKSPNSYGYNYANGLNCQYDIKVPFGYRPKLSWSTFDVKGYMPSCHDDYVEIYIGCLPNKESIGKFCSENSQIPFNIYSPDRCIQLVFKTDSSGGGKGFNAHYESIRQGSSSFLGSGSCSGTKTLYSNSGVIHSYKWPLSDSLSRSCYWKIDVGSYKAIRIAFMDVDLDFDWGCDNDKVKVKGGSSGQSYDSSSTIKASMCGSKKPFSLTSTKDRIWIRFKSNGYNTERGFVAGYVLYDDATKSSSSGSSPVIGIVVAIIVFAVVAGCIFYIFVYRRRVLMRQRGAQNQAVPVPLQTSVSTTQTTIHHAPPPPQPGYAPPPGSGYAPAPPLGYAPPPKGYPPPLSNAPPPYSQVATAPYPPQDKAAPYPPPQGGAPPYLFGQPGAPAPYPPGQPGATAPYPPGQPGATAPYPPGQPGATAPYPPGQPEATAPYPPGQPGAPVTNPTAPPVGAAYPPK
ncbi:tolloid-like protein 1 isoform X2 [Acropora millepora]|uniref:tolloid-like protein 1 isoform X2 n=1 Tax=Acropora millepora TaxID=45264 RepID=UPI001CF2B34B|nr:tolloid-like protein 1 isoform X2 [Acropora millepora]